jgi:hypothetical protein
MKLGPGLSFSWKRAIGVTKAKRSIARATGIPTTRSGRRNKLGRWMGSRKIYASKNYLFLKSPSTGTAWTSNSQPGDNLWRIDPNATFNPLINGELNPLDYQVVINATEYISIAKIATTSLDNKAKLTGRDLNDPDLAKIIGDIDEAGLFTKAAAANKELQPVSIVKL